MNSFIFSGQGEIQNEELVNTEENYLGFPSVRLSIYFSHLQNITYYTISLCIKKKLCQNAEALCEKLITLRDSVALQHFNHIAVWALNEQLQQADSFLFSAIQLDLRYCEWNCCPIA